MRTAAASVRAAAAGGWQASAGPDGAAARRVEARERRKLAGSDSGLDSDELLTLDELMDRCVVDFDREAHAGPS